MLLDCFEPVLPCTTSKIIPDGFPEIIFHFGQPYRINLSGNWEQQELNLLAGQVTTYFLLENTGPSDILGIKLKPSAVTRLFDIDMSSIKNKVIDIQSVTNETLRALVNTIRSAQTHTDRIEEINRFLKQIASLKKTNKTIEKAVELILDSHGTTLVGSLAQSCNVGERQIERLFNTYIGLSPKFYGRIIRFSHIFEVMQKGKISWADVSFASGFYDQPHFIKNFKAFAGEDPTRYFFDEATMANFFLKKS